MLMNREGYLCASINIYKGKYWTSVGANNYIIILPVSAGVAVCTSTFAIDFDVPENSKSIMKGMMKH